MKIVDCYAAHNDLVGRNISTDNLYTSIPLANDLLDRGVTLVGTVRANRKGIPAEVKSLDGREENSTEVWWEKKKESSLFNHML